MLVKEGNCKMITIDELENMKGKLREIQAENSEIFHKLSDDLKRLMGDYQEIALWYLENNFVWYNEIGSVIYLSEDDDYVYYWEPNRKEEANAIKRYDLKQGKTRGYYNPYVFVQKGHYESARKHILELNDAFSYVLESEKRRNLKLKEILQKI